MSVDAGSPRQPVLINCANLISSHQSLQRAFLGELARAASNCRRTGFLAEVVILTLSTFSGCPSSPRPDEIRLSVWSSLPCTAVRNIKAIFPGETGGSRQGVLRPGDPGWREDSCLAVGASPHLTVTSAAPPGSWGVAGGLLVAGYTRDGTVLGLSHRAAWSLVPWPSPRAGLEESDAAPGIRLTWVTSYGLGPSLTCPVPLGLRPPAHFSTGWCGLWGTATTGQVSPVHHAHSFQEVGCGDPCRVGPSGTGRQGFGGPLSSSGLLSGLPSCTPSVRAVLTCPPEDREHTPRCVTTCQGAPRSPGKAAGARVPGRVPPPLPRFPPSRFRAVCLSGTFAASLPVPATCAEWQLAVHLRTGAQGFGETLEPSPGPR